MKHKLLKMDDESGPVESGGLLAGIDRWAGWLLGLESAGEKKAEPSAAADGPLNEGEEAEEYEHDGAWSHDYHDDHEEL